MPVVADVMNEREDVSCTNEQDLARAKKRRAKAPRTAGTLRRVANPASRLSRLLAGVQYEGRGRPVAARYYAEAPQETGREGPLWRVDFDDAERTSFYLSPETGEVVTRRSNVWRFYDFFWRLHIMDLENGEDFNHPLIIVATSLTLSIVISGFILLAIRLGRDWKSWRAQGRASRAAR